MVRFWLFAQEFNRSVKAIYQNHIDHVKHVKAIMEEKQRQDDNSCPEVRQANDLRTARSVDNQGKQFWDVLGFKCRTVRRIA